MFWAASNVRHGDYGNRRFRVSVCLIVERLRRGNTAERINVLPGLKYRGHDKNCVRREPQLPPRIRCGLRRITLATCCLCRSVQHYERHWRSGAQPSIRGTPKNKPGLTFSSAVCFSHRLSGSLRFVLFKRTQLFISPRYGSRDQPAVRNRAIVKIIFFQISLQWQRKKGHFMTTLCLSQLYRVILRKQRTWYILGSTLSQPKRVVFSPFGPAVVLLIRDKQSCTWVQMLRTQPDPWKSWPDPTLPDPLIHVSSASWTRPDPWTIHDG